MISKPVVHLKGKEKQENLSWFDSMNVSPNITENIIWIENKQAKWKL